MEKFSAIAQISILLLIAFLIGILMTWWYLRRRYRNAQAYEGETKDLEIQRLSGELKRYSSVFEGKSPEVFRKKQEGILFEKEEQIKGLKEELKNISQVENTEGSSELLDEIKSELEGKDRELLRLKEQMEELSVNGESLTPKEFLAWTESALEAKTAEISQLNQELDSLKAEAEKRVSAAPATVFSDGQMLAEQLGELRWALSDKEQQVQDLEARLHEEQEAIELKSTSLAMQPSAEENGEKNLLAEQLGELRWELSDKEQQLGTLQTQLGQKTQDLTRLSAELGQLKYVDIDGVEQNPWDLVAQLRGELQAKEAEMAQPIVPPEAEEEKKHLTEQLGEFRWALSDKEEKLKTLEAQLNQKNQDLTRLSAELGQLKYVDMDGTEQNPWDFVAQLRGELDAKETEMAILAGNKESTENEEKNLLASQLGELRWELSEKAQELGFMNEKLGQKTQDITRLSAELGQLKYVDMDGSEQNPWDFVAQLRGEMEAKEAEMTERLQAKEAELAQLTSQQEATQQEEKNQFAEQLGELRWALSDKENKVKTLETQMNQKTQDLTRLSAELGQLKYVDMDGLEQNPWDFVAQLRGEMEAKEVEMTERLQAKEAELAQLTSQQEATQQEEKNNFAEQLGEIRWELSEKAEQVQALESQLGRKTQDITRLSAELGQLKYVDMDGLEQNPWDFVAQLRGEMEAKEVEMTERMQAKEAELAQLTSQQEATQQEEKNQFAEQLGEIRWELSEKAEQVQALESQLGRKTQDITRLSAELGQLKYVDMDGLEQNPWDFVAQLRGEMEAKEVEMTERMQAKEAELAQLTSQQEATQQEEKNNFAQQLGEIRWELSEKAEQVQALESQLGRKTQDITRLSAELGQLKYVDMDGLEQNPWDFVAQLRGEMEAKEAEMAELVQAKHDAQVEGENKQAEILRLEGSLAQFNLEGKTVTPGEYRAHFASQLQQKDQELEGMLAEVNQLKQQFHSAGLDNGESLVEYMAQKNKEIEARDQELNHLKEQMNQFSWKGIRLSPGDYMAKRDAEVEAKDKEIAHLLGELSHLSWEGAQLRPVDFANKMKEQLQAKEQIVADSEEEIRNLKEELEKLKFVEVQEQNGEEDLEWREREAEIVRLSAENEQLRKGYSAQGISIDETYMDFIPEDIYKLLVEYGDEGISLSNHNGYFLVFNDRLQDLTEYSKVEANDTSEKIFLEKIYPDPVYRTEVAQQIANIPEDGSFNSVRTQITTKYGKKRDLDVASTTFYHKGMKYYLSAYVDIEGEA